MTPLDETVDAVREFFYGINDARADSMQHAIDRLHQVSLADGAAAVATLAFELEQIRHIMIQRKAVA